MDIIIKIITFPFTFIRDFVAFVASTAPDVPEKETNKQKKSHKKK